MFQPDSAIHMDGFQLAKWIYAEGKFWLGFATALWYVFRAWNWVKAIKTNDLHHIQGSLDELHKKVGDQTKEISGQTTAIVGELSELRNDFRTFYKSPRRTPRRRTK